MPIIRSLKMLRPEPPAEPVQVPVEEKLAIEEMVPDIPAKVIPEEPVEKTVEEPIVEKTAEEPAQPEPEEIKAEEPAKEEPEEEKPVKEEAEKEEPPKKTRKRSAKTKTEEEPEEVVCVNNNLKKGQDLRDAVASVTVEYYDPAFAAFKEQLEKDLVRTNFDDQANSGIVRMILSNLSRCFDNVTREYAFVNSNLEQLTNKSYGLIPRQIVMNATAGTNEVSRKRNGVHAPEVYKTDSGSTINLYALQAGLEQEAAYLQMIMKQLEYKRSTLIAYLTANKLEAGIGD